MSLLPGQILPQSTPIGTVNQDGKGNVIIDKNWWLFLYNLAQNILSTGTGTAAVTNTEQILLNEIDARVSDTVGGGGSGSGTVTSFSFTNANGFTGTVTNSTTTPNLTLSSSFMDNPMTTEGDIIFEDATPAPNRLAIGTTGQILTVASGLPAWAANAGTGNVALYNAAGSYTWTKPANVSNIYMLALGAGGNGGNGYAQSAPPSVANGGGGGGSGGQSCLVIPAYLLPDTLYVVVAAGGTASGSTSWTYIQVNNGSQSTQATLLFAFAGGNGGNATSSTGGAAGSAASANTLSNASVLSAMGQYLFFGGVVGDAGTHSTNMGNLAHASSGIFLCAGGGGAGPNSSNGPASGYSGRGQAAYGTLYANIVGGAAGTNAPTGGGNGVDGTTDPSGTGLFFPMGGCGGGATGISSGNTYSTAGNGGKGANGCGGGGGAGGFGSAGTGGAGGDGLVLIVSV